MKSSYDILAVLLFRVSLCQTEREAHTEGEEDEVAMNFDLDLCCTQRMNPTDSVDTLTNFKITETYKD